MQVCMSNGSGGGCCGVSLRAPMGVAAVEAQYVGVDDSVAVVDFTGALVATLVVQIGLGNACCTCWQCGLKLDSGLRQLHWCKVVYPRRWRTLRTTSGVGCTTNDDEERWHY